MATVDYFAQDANDYESELSRLYDLKEEDFVHHLRFTMIENLQNLVVVAIIVIDAEEVETTLISSC